MPGPESESSRTDNADVDVNMFMNRESKVLTSREKYNLILPIMLNIVTLSYDSLLT